MRRAVLFACVVAGCSGSDAPAPPAPPRTPEAARPAPPVAPAPVVPPPVEPAPGAPAPSTWRAALAERAPLGCTVHALDRGTVVWGTGDDAVVAWAGSLERSDDAPAIPPSVIGHVASDPEWIPTPSGLCAARLGPAVLLGDGFPIIGRRVHGCDHAAPLVLACPATTTPPSDLQYTALTFERALPIDPDDDVVSAMLADVASLLPPPRRQEYADMSARHLTLARHVRTATFATAAEELRATELALAYFASPADIAHGCPENEFLVGAVTLRSGHGWTRAAVGVDYVGVLRQGGSVVALVSDRRAEGEDCGGAASCLSVALHARTGDASFGGGPSAPHAQTSGELSVTSPGSYFFHRYDCEP